MPVVAGGKRFRYLRYLSSHADGHGNVAEIEFYNTVSADGRKADPDRSPVRSIAPANGGVTLVVGTSPGSPQAAQIIADAIRAIPGQQAWSNVKAAAAFDAEDRNVTGTTHVIAVGTLRDNVVLRGRDWLPTWWIDRDWYFNEYDQSISMAQFDIPFEARSGFIAAGFGDWHQGDGRIGVIEVERSPLFMEWMVRNRYDPDKDWDTVGMTSPSYPKQFPMLLLTRISGSGDAG